ncbi:amidohydrolase family protein [Eudoraea chungangensis]|uniref:amidohydrolase family protein n=1 Tax=Eudoraea chungangensis TaxID=1481905 RepID=UPI0023EB318D|nr:amidohydrolase family protein [Eudoraea chungangensis]
MRITFFKYISLFFLFFHCTPNSIEIDLVVANGSLIHLEDGSISKGNIYVNNGVILGVGEAKEFPNLNPRKELDASDKYVLPGFWDNHVHFRGGIGLVKDNKKFLDLFLANGITTVRDAGGDLATEVLTWRTAINNKTMLGPTIFTAGPKIDGPNPTWEGSLEVTNEMEVAKALDSLGGLQIDFVKLYDSKISSEAYLLAIKEATKRGYITSGHMPYSVSFQEAVKTGLGATEHLYYVFKGCSSKEQEITDLVDAGEIGFWEALQELLKSYDEESAERTFELLKKHQTFVVPTLHIMHTLSYLDEEDHASDKYLKYFSPAFIKTYQRRINAAVNASEENKKSRKSLDSIFRSLNSKLDHAGVSLLAGSDCGAYNSYIYPGISLHKEMAALVQSGLSPLQALRTSTFNGAIFLKKEGDYGSIAKGKISDLVILNANPLENIENSEDIYAVLKGEQLLQKQDLQKLLSN